MNNCGTGAEKVCRFVSTRSFDTLRMTKFFICARNENLFGAFLLTECATSKTEHEPQRRRANKRRAYVTHKPILQRLQLVAIVCLLVFVFLFPTRQKLRFHLSYSHPSSLVFDVREPLCVKYENAWHCVAQAATQAKWHNKGTIPIYASADCLPRE